MGSLIPINPIERQSCPSGQRKAPSRGVAPTHPNTHHVPEFLRAQGVLSSPTTHVHLKIGNWCAQGSTQRPSFPLPPPPLLQMEVVLTGSPATKEQSAVIRAHLRTAQGLPDNPSMPLTPDEKGLSPWAIFLQHPPPEEPVLGKWPRLNHPEDCGLASCTTAACPCGHNATQSPVWSSSWSHPLCVAQV